MNSNSSLDASRVYIDITEEDADNSTSEAEAELHKKIAVLQAQVHMLLEENSGLKSKLIATQLELGKAVTANAMQVIYILFMDFTS